MGVGDIYKITQNVLLIDNVTAQNVQYLRQDTSGSGQISDIRDDIDNWIAQIYSPLIPFMVDSAFVTDWKMEVKTPGTCDFNLFTDGAVSFQGDLSFPQNMTAHGVALQANARLVGYGRVGKKFWAGFGDGTMLDGTWQAAILGGALSAAVGWITPFVGVGSNASWVPGVWSCVRLLFFNFSGTIITKPVGSYQRRRKPGVGI